MFTITYNYNGNAVFCIEELIKIDNAMVSLFNSEHYHYKNNLYICSLTLYLLLLYII